MGRKLPTAVQFSDDEYISFNSTGAYACSTRVGDSINRKFLPDGSWCLSDGNAHVRCPCYAFGRKGLRPFVITPSPPSNNLWRANFGADTVITDLPRTVEVAAIAYVLSRALSSKPVWRSFSYDLILIVICLVTTRTPVIAVKPSP